MTAPPHWLQRIAIFAPVLACPVGVLLGCLPLWIGLPLFYMLLIAAGCLISWILWRADQALR